MPVTFRDLLERLKHEPEITVMELLEITSEDLVNRFEDKIRDKADWLANEVDEEMEFDEEEEWN